MSVGVASKSEEVYLELRRQLLNGELRAGERLAQRPLAQRLGVSAIPVLEALRRLERDGLVVSTPNVGATVREWTREDIEGAYLAREVLEGLAARLFVERATTLERRALAALADELEESLAAGATARCRELDLAFHLQLVRSTHAGTLARLVESSCLVTLTIFSHPQDAAQPPRSPEPGQHRQLVAVLAGQDASAAEAAARAHVHYGLVMLLGG